MTKDKAPCRSLHALVCAVAVALPTFGGGPGDEMRLLRCVRRIEVPEYSPLARQARQTGTAVTTVTLGEGGTVQRVDVVDVKGLLKADVERAIRESEFSPACRGERLSFMFTFSLREPPDHFPRPSVAFTPPNHFFISVNVPLINP